MSYGQCKLLKESESLYLVEVEKNWAKYIVCNYMDDMGNMVNQEFFETYEQALEYYNLKV